MARSIRDVSARLTQRARSLELHLSRVEKLFTQEKILLSDVHWIYGGALVRFTLEVEGAVEDLFMGLLAGRYVSANRKVKPLIQARTYKLADRVLRATRPYVEWLPIGKTLLLADIYLHDGKPFRDIPSAQLGTLLTLTTIRNAIAHRSESSKRKFHKHCVRGKPLLRVEKSPAGYLRGFHAGTQTRLNYLMSEVVFTVNDLAI